MQHSESFAGSMRGSYGSDGPKTNYSYSKSRKISGKNKHKNADGSDVSDSAVNKNSNKNPGFRFPLVPNEELVAMIIARTTRDPNLVYNNSDGHIPGNQRQ